jgi:hypothetical protein
VNRQRIRAYSWVAGCTLLGVLIGLGAGRAWAEHDAAHALFDGDHESRERLFQEALNRELDLNAAQRDAVAAITERHASARRQAVRRVFAECGKDLTALHEQVDSEILAQLNPSQQERYRDWSERRKRRWRGDGEQQAR